jgi:hypothetical protein
MTEYLSNDRDDELWRNGCEPVEEFLRTERVLSVFSRASESLESMRWLNVLEQEFQQQYNAAPGPFEAPRSLQ